MGNEETVENTEKSSTVEQAGDGGEKAAVEESTESTEESASESSEETTES